MKNRELCFKSNDVNTNKPYIVSYLIALYNKENYILECIDSILNEATSNIEIEICIVDDGSQDNSLSIVKEYYSDNPNIKIASFPYNKGKNAAYNKAFELSKGDYLCIFGADDIVFPNRTAILLNYAIQSNMSVYGDKVRLVDGIDDSKKIIKKNFLHPKRGNEIKLNFFDNVMQNTLSGGCGFILREHANEILPIPEHLKFEDWWISYHLLKKNWVSAYSDVVTIYRIHDGNDAASNKNKYITMKQDYLRHFDYLKEFSSVSTSKEEDKAIKKSLAIRESFFKKYKLSHIKTLSFDRYSLRILSFYLIGSETVCSIKERLDNFNV